MSEYSYNADAKEATAFTKQHNAAFAQQFAIDLEDAYNSEVALARRGCLKQQTVADTVHPSLWLNGKANIEAGVFEVLAGKIYQVRGIDVANLTFVRSKTGWIVIDVTTNTEAAAYGLRITEEVLGENIHDHIRAVIISTPTPTISAASRASFPRNRWGRQRDRYAFTCRQALTKKLSRKTFTPEQRCSTVPSTSSAATCSPVPRAEFPQGWDWGLLPERSAISRLPILLRRIPR